jgi:hypothetical protein
MGHTIIVHCHQTKDASMNSVDSRRPIRLALRSFAIAAGLATVLVGVPSASAGSAPPGYPVSPPGQGVPKLEGQLKNGYNHLCMDSGGSKYTGKKVKPGATIRFKKCLTVNGGYTAASQYFFLNPTAYGMEIETKYAYCVALRLSGNPTEGESLTTKKCSPADSTTIFQQVGDNDGVHYWAAKKTNYQATKLAIGYRTKSVGASVALNPNKRDSSQAWHGKLLSTQS